MEYSIAHRDEMNKIVQKLWPDTGVPWDEAQPPDLTSGDERRLVGRLRYCTFCGSMHPADVAAAIRAGAHGSWADMKYGWPHKAYFHGVPNPHVGLLESRSSASYQVGEDWVQTRDGVWRAPGTPAPATVMWKFYTVHLLDATPEDRAVIEQHLGLHFEFSEDGHVSWQSWGTDGSHRQQAR